MSEDEPREAPGRVERPDRRRALAAGGLAALLGLGALLVGDWTDDGDDSPPATPGADGAATGSPTPEPTPSAEWLPLVERFAPELHFGRRERWFPTDPRPYATEVGGRSVVEGLDALRAYGRERRAAGGPPRPTVFYHVVPGAGSTVALQYWMYSVFDQFTVNFHWHDWELLQVFVDADTGEARLFSASAHARSCPNNEYLGPAPGVRPVVLAEVGSHSSATDVNDRRSSFERLGPDPLGADVSNGFVRPIDRLVEQPFAYGLPRDEGARLPYVMPELDGSPLSALPGLGPADFVPDDVTVRAWGDLARPPTDVPLREPGTVLTPPGGAAEGDATYELVPLEAARTRIDDFVGPQLSFEFGVPGFVEDRIASHITTAGVPWEDPRHADPLGDVTDPAHVRAIGGEATAALADRVVGAVSLLVDGADRHLDAVPGGDPGPLAPFVPVSLAALPVEAACLLRSDPVAVATAGGVFRFLRVSRGAHELVVNVPGAAPYAGGFVHAGGTVRPGAEGRIVVVPTEDAVPLRVDGRGAGGLARVRVVESFVGPVLDAVPTEPDRLAAHVHRDGEYTVEVVDGDGVRGAATVDAGELGGEPVRVETGKAALAGQLASSLAETAGLARELSPEDAADREGQSDGAAAVPAGFDAASGAAEAAVDAAADGEAMVANERLVEAVDHLLGVRSLLGGSDRAGYGAAAASALRHRAAVAVDRAEAAYATPVVA